MMSDGLTPRARDIVAIVAGQGSRSPLTYLLTEAGVRPAASASTGRMGSLHAATHGKREGKPGAIPKSRLPT